MTELTEQHPPYCDGYDLQQPVAGDMNVYVKH